MLAIFGAVFLTLAVLALILLAPTALAHVSDALLRAGVVGAEEDLVNENDSLSAFLSGIATLGVAVALFVQIRQIRMSQAQVVRTMQIDLMRLLIEDPNLRPLSTLGDVRIEQRRRDIFTNLLMRYMEMGYEIGYFSVSSVLAEFQKQFTNPDIRRFWEGYSADFEASAQNRRQWEFLALANWAFDSTRPTRRSTKEGPARAGPPVPGDTRRRHSLVYFCLGAFLGALLAQRQGVRSAYKKNTTGAAESPLRR